MRPTLTVLLTWTVFAGFACTQLFAEYVYWTDRDGHAIRRGLLDGTSPAEAVLTAADGLNEPRGLGLDMANEKLYWVDSGTLAIRRANLDGSGVEDLITDGFVFPADLELDVTAGKIYWTDTGLGQILRANLDGSNVEAVRSGLSQPYYFGLDTAAGMIYWGENDNTVIHSSNLDGTGPIVDVITGQARVRDVAVFDGMIYWSDRQSSLIQRAPLDGGPSEVLFSAAGTNGKPHGLALDPIGGMAYWTDTRTNWVARGAMDGSGSQEFIYMNLSDAWDVEVAVVPEPGTVVMLLIGAVVFLVVRRRR